MIMELQAWLDEIHRRSREATARIDLVILESQLQIQRIDDVLDRLESEPSAAGSKRARDNS
jgi:hypothetical protein